MPKQNAYRFYILRVFVLTLLSLSLIAGVNAGIDPYEALGTIQIRGVNNVKSEKNLQVRLFKTLAINRLQVQSVFLGSSRTEFGLDSHHPALKNQQPGYNLAISGGNMYEVRRYFDHVMATQPDVKKIVLGIDFFMFNQFQQVTPDFNENRLEVRRIIFKDFFDILFSKSSLIASVRTVRSSRREPDSIGSFYPDGRINPDFYIAKAYQNQPTKARFSQVLQDFMTRDDLYGNYQLSRDYLEDLKAVITTSQAREIQLTIFISPSHAMQWEAIRVSGLWSQFEQWKREIVQFAPIWDFSGYNSITTEPLTDSMVYYIESSHYRKEVGDLILNRILNYNLDVVYLEGVPPDFGVLLTPNNLEDHLAQIRQDRAVWVKNNPEWVEFVEGLKPE
ncbi:hypothetical protein K4A83_12340 [Spirulina subsalsa FACHB-351]|uniref:AlgX/AlgJ SGNH hydrolase-like domain-containing protein n=1 Tax=Spirulina subsalsa FACHB-351 TaxID=234711 RepID=A0ABT3L6D7_9CYAN|nr:hypothetical protein [Spirulina subsalsa]MCW6037050.1 hypothetical protein [Spirulina subsalsa FACHB-351]